MTRTLALVQWTLRPDRDDDAPPLTHRFRCLTLTDDDSECGAVSEPHTDPVDAQAWTFRHLRDHPEHTSYAEVIERPWVMWRGGRA
ncbi:DUF7848 domain-containing protein [Streptomyces fulvorobeus]|uniref:DUF7848 domain-containing protein n=1 Tax=Streptomyces fulvorobeus TaxID=284028 RepID=A0A7J0C3V2_9ACTN|nr:hypothetical protein [Streptomyces fulvorobeus]NYE40745.1 hypothetical protein [Streptomyces fulvorobeus]GFM97048.1 hypothetical protein Sfulv_18590 [Streptomyces fulvorobeus]